MNEIMNYVKPELIVVAVVLYFIGLGFKKAQYFACLLYTSPSPRDTR